MDCVQICPLPRRYLVVRPTILVLLGNLGHERVIRIRVGQHGQNGEKDLRNCQSRRPILLQNIKTDEARCVDIWMVNLRGEDNARRLERIVNRKLDCHMEDAPAVGGICGSEHDTLPVIHIVFIDRAGTAVRGRVLPKISEFTCDSLG